MADDTSKGISIEELENPAQYQKRTNYLLAIGIDDYVHCPKLYNCKKDVDDLIVVLTSKYNFEKKHIKTLFNAKATRRNIYGAFMEMAEKLTSADNLIVYFSGHGEYNKTIGKGFWIPVNAEQGDYSQYFNNSEIKDLLSAVKCHHVFLMSDSCFSGSLFAKGVGKNVSRRYEKDPSRWGLTAGRNEIVSDGKPGDNSPFAESLLYRLKNTDRSLGVAELCAHVTEHVQANSTQTPIGEPLKVDGHKNGQFVFHLKKDALTDWKNAEAAGTVVAYRAFIKMHPKHANSAKAKEKIAALEAEILWAEIEKAPEANARAVVKKIRLVDRYCEKYEAQTHYSEALDLGILLEYKRDFFDAKYSEFALKKFLRKQMPKVNGAAEIRAKAADLIAGKRATEDKAKAENERRRRENEAKENAAREQKERERKAAEEKRRKESEQIAYAKTSDPAAPKPQPNNLKYILGGIGTIVAAAIIYFASTCGGGATIDDQPDPQLTQSELAEVAWSRIPKDNADSLKWFIGKYAESKFIASAKSDLEALKKAVEPIATPKKKEEKISEKKPTEKPKAEKQPEKKTIPPPQLYVKKSGEDQVKITIKNGSPPYVLQVEKDGRRKDTENYKRSGTHTYSIEKYRDNSGVYTFILKDDLGKSDKATATVNPRPKKKEVTKPIVKTVPPPKPKPSTSKPQMVSVPGGTFQMGSNDGDDDEKPIHSVTVGSFSISKYEVTNEQYAAFLNAEGKHEDKWIKLDGSYGNEKCRIRKTGSRYTVETGYEKHPVIYVSWYGAEAYAKYYGMRLPTEAEWEFAARGGKKSRGYKYSGSNSPDDVAWYTKTTNDKGTRKVGTKRANELGIYDMSGNVWEWCAGGKRAYSNNSVTNPKGPKPGSNQSAVLRGGSWFLSDSNCRSAYRDYINPANRVNGFGFRCAGAN